MMGLPTPNARPACVARMTARIGEDPKSTPFVPVNPGKALGDLAGIAEVRQHKFFDLILTAARLARRDNEVLNMAAKLAFNIPSPHLRRNP
jgi:hypothetical protein